MKVGETKAWKNQYRTSFFFCSNDPSKHVSKSWIKIVYVQAEEWSPYWTWGASRRHEKLLLHSNLVHFQWRIFVTYPQKWTNYTQLIFMLNLSLTNSWTGLSNKRNKFSNKAVHVENSLFTYSSSIKLWLPLRDLTWICDPKSTDFSKWKSANLLVQPFGWNNKLFVLIYLDR